MAFINNPQARENELVVQDLKGEVLIYDLNVNKAYCLNPTSAAIWNLCDGQNSVSDISRKLSGQLKQPVTDDLIYLALDQFKTDHLLSDKQETEIKFDGLSRREAIRKIGFASMIALPVIASLVAPTAAMAQSAGAGAANCSACTTAAECASGNCASNICSAGSETFLARPSGAAGFAADAASCTTTASQICCQGTATFSAPNTCTCD